MENNHSQHDDGRALTVVLVTPDMSFRQRLDETALLSVGCKYAIKDQAAADAFLAKLKAAKLGDAGNVGAQDFDVRYKLTFHTKSIDPAIERVLLGPYQGNAVGLMAGSGDQSYTKGATFNEQVFSDIMQLVRTHAGLTQPVQECDAYILNHYK